LSKATVFKVKLKKRNMISTRNVLSDIFFSLFNYYPYLNFPFVDKIGNDAGCLLIVNIIHTQIPEVESLVISKLYLWDMVGPKP
jgi:hypothetical protein